MSQFITVITQEQVIEIQLQCNLVMERSKQNSLKFGNILHDDDDDDSDRASCIHYSKKISCIGDSTSVFFVP